MATSDNILNFLNEKKSATGREICEFLGISRQAVNKHIKSLIENGKLIKEGTTKGAIYKIHGRIKPKKRFMKQFNLKELEEDLVFDEIELLLNLESNLRKNVLDIVRYSFTEILNNAIEHSFSKTSDINIAMDQYRYSFKIRDYGIGIFSSIYKKFNLPDENAAIGELIKGKTTTMREKHTGEGVFFSSKSGDKMTFRSHQIKLLFDNINHDIFVEKKRFIEGTEVTFEISCASKRKLDNIFRNFAPADFDYKFEKTHVYVKLFQKEYISRSEARRLLTGLDKFKEIILDFKGVTLLGQGFADEIFRVFTNKHRKIEIKIKNINPILNTIIKHVVDKNS